MQIMSKNVFRVFLTQIAMIRAKSVGVSLIGRIKNPDRKCDVPRGYSGTLDPLTLVVKREHHCCFYLMAAMFLTELRETDGDPNR